MNTTTISASKILSIASATKYVFSNAPVLQAITVVHVLAPRSCHTFLTNNNWVNTRKFSWLATVAKEDLFF